MQPSINIPEFFQIRAIMIKILNLTYDFIVLKIKAMINAIQIFWYS